MKPASEQSRRPWPSVEASLMVLATLCIVFCATLRADPVLEARNAARYKSPSEFAPVLLRRPAIRDAPDLHLLPVGNAGNITAYWAGYGEYRAAGKSVKLPVMLGFQAAGKSHMGLQAGPPFHKTRRLRGIRPRGA